jgi:hypothetical protein
MLIRPLISKTHNSSSSEDLDFSYEVRGNLQWNVGENWSLVALGEYYYLPLKYNIIEYGGIDLGGNHSLITSKESIEHESFTWMTKLVTPFKITGDARLSFGYGQRQNRIDGIDKELDHLISVGIDSTF